MHTTGQSRVALHTTAVLTPLLVATLVAWAVAVEQMQGMDAGPGTDLGAFAWFAGIWLTMTVAMMLPSAALTTLMFSRLGRGSDTPLFVGGYLLSWTAFGAAAYIVSRSAREVAPSFVAWDERGPWVAGAALAAAGLYQLTPLKTSCLRHCRSPLHFLIRRRGGQLAAVGAGLGHGGYCIGCCAGLMLALFALGIMSLFWMAVAAAAILVEKMLPGGEVFARVLARRARRAGNMDRPLARERAGTAAAGSDADAGEDAAVSWRISGSYFESCNCDAICPCRRTNGTPGGRSTHGICMGVLSWLIDEGSADGVDLSGLPVALAVRYSDDEPGSPWSWILYLDAQADKEQRAMLEAIFTGPARWRRARSLSLGLEGEQAGRGPQRSTSRSTTPRDDSGCGSATSSASGSGTATPAARR